MTEVERASTYRERAKELLAIAEMVRDEEQQKRLRDLADEYEKMAVNLSTARARQTRGLMGEDVAVAPAGEV